MKYHFIGICGAGMSAVAKLLIESGHAVTGSDEGFYPPISDYLKLHKIPCHTPYKKENIPTDVDIVVIGKHAALTKEDNEEVREVFDRGYTIRSFPEVLASIMKDKERIVVAGSYGKSTCTSLLAWVLEHSGKDPGYFIGALPRTPKTNASLGRGSYCVLEGDEYPSTNWDTTSKFLYYKPHHLLLTALAHDHVNVFPTHEAYLAPFFRLVEELPSEGLLVACVDDETIRNNHTHMKHDRYITYGLTRNASWSATDIVYGEKSTCTLTKDGVPVTSLTTHLLGKHNIQNIIGVAALLLETKSVTVQELVDGIATFEGIVRRLDRKSTATRIPVYEGFGSSIDKARAAIDAILTHFTGRELVVVFEPHTFSWRNRAALHWYDSVFTGASSVYIYKPPLHGSTTHEQLTHDEILGRVQATGIPAKSFISPTDGVTEIVQTIHEKSVILILSSGGMEGFIPTLVEALEKQYPNI
jgi:UDP-N-acetylmuramate: L-alanyl-gamma-D-glutamyl-meso-diaminopimelate ligase